VSAFVGKLATVATRESPTLNVLREIRDEVKANRAEIQETNVRLGRLEAGVEQLDASVERLGQRVESLEHRQVETEMRLATELIAVTHAVEGVKDLLRD
jgi:predicted  nucleic acid-binding Zn-ribbon protein